MARKKRNPNLRRDLERLYRKGKIKLKVHPRCRLKPNGKFPEDCQIHHKTSLNCGGTDKPSNLTVVPIKLHNYKHRNGYSC